MATYIVSIGEYREGKEEWSQYTEHLNHFLSANCIKDGKKKDIFLTVIGLQTYKLLKSLVASAKPGEKNYTQLVEVLTQHFDPAPSEIVQRYHFNARNQRKGETVTTYVSELRELAQFCNFRESLDTMLRDCLVCRINDEAMQCHLLTEANNKKNGFVCYRCE